MRILGRFEFHPHFFDFIGDHLRHLRLSLRTNLTTD